MSIRTKVLGMVDIMMRVPPIIIIDELLKIGLGLPGQYVASTANSMDSGGGSDIVDAIGLNNTANLNPLLNITTATTTTLEVTEAVAAAAAAAVVNSSTTAATSSVLNATASGFFSNAFGTLLEEMANDTYITDLLSITTIKFIICLFGKCTNF